MASKRKVPGLDIDGTRVRKSPFFEATGRYGCKTYDIYNHMYIPGNFGDTLEEYWQLVNNVALWDVGVGEDAQLIRPAKCHVAAGHQ